MSKLRSDYIISHEGYKAALWDRHKKPECFVDSDDAIVIAHNKACGTMQAVHERELTIIVRINDGLALENRQLRARNELLGEKLRRQSETIRRLGEELKTIKLEIAA